MVPIVQRDLDFALHFKADVKNAKDEIQKNVIDPIKQVDEAVKQNNSSQQQASNIQNKAAQARKNLASSIEQQAQSESKAAQTTQSLSETTEQAAARIKKMVEASLANRKAAEDSAKANEQVAKSITTVNNQLDQSANAWQKSFAAQNAAMRTYHEAQQAAERQAAAEAAQAENAQKTAAENTKKMASLQKLMGSLDKTEKALNELDKKEQELRQHFKEGRLSVDDYNNALAKIQAKRNALSTIGNDADKSTKKVNKLSKAVRSLSGIIATGFAGYGVVQFGKAIVQSTLEWDKAKTIMNNATGSASKAASELEFVRGVSQKLNIELLSAATSYSKLVAAAQGSPELANQVQGMFQGVSEAAAVLKLAPHEVNSILVNFEQMLSKGKVDLTDLKQIANLIPGTMEKAAKGLGTTTTQMSEWISKGLVPASEFLPRFADELHNAFGGSAQEAAQGLQGQLTALTNAWTDLKREAGNAGFIDTFTGAVKELHKVLQDPVVKQGLNQLMELAGKAVTFTIKIVGNVPDFAKFIGEEAAFQTTGETAFDDIVRKQELVKNNLKEIARLQNNIATMEQPGFQLSFLERLQGHTVESEIARAKKNIAFMEETNEKLVEEIEKLSNKASEPIKIAEPLDPLIENYQNAANRLAGVRKEIADGNKELDASLAEADYQKAIDAINQYIAEQENALKDRNNVLLVFQQEYLASLATLSAEEKAIREGDIEQAKTAVARLTAEIQKYKSVLQSVKPAFIPNKSENNNKGKTAAQRLAEQNENYVKGLEKQIATQNLGKIATLEYEIAQRKLTGTLLERANAAKQALVEQQNLDNQKANVRSNIELLRLTGNDYQADLLELEAKFKETTESLKKEGNTAGLEIAKNLFDAGKAKVELDKIKTEIERAFSNQSIQEQSIQAQVTAKVISQYEAQKRIAALHKQTAATVKQYLPELEKAAQIPGVLGEQSRQYLTDINSQLLTLQTTTSELENAFRNGMQDGIQSSIEGLRQGTMDLQDALLNIFESIGSNILNYAIQSLAENATGEITGAFSSLGSFFGFGMETPETYPQALAITTASQEGAMAMQMGIEQGAMMAAQTLSTVMSSMGATNGLTGLGGEAGLFGDVTQNATEAVSAISGVTAAKTAADATIMASAATSTATTQATTTAAAASAQAAWAPAAATAATASFGTAAMIGLAALMAVMTAVKAFKDGGHVQGPGTGKSDSIPAWLSNDEFVIQSDVVRQPGMLSFLNSLNRNGLAAIPRVKHATGGLAGIPAPNVQVPSYAGIEPVENVNNNSTSFNPNINVGVIQTDEQLAKFINSDRGKDSILKLVKANPGEFKSVMDLG